MKSLKERLREECDGQCSYLSPEQVIKIIKEWLNDNANEETAICEFGQGCDFNPNHNCKTCKSGDWYISLDKLLEDLKK